MHLEERVRLSHSTLAHITTTELTNRNQQEKCRACLNLTQRAHKSPFRKMFYIIIIALLHCTIYYDIHIIEVIDVIQRFLYLPESEIAAKKKRTKKRTIIVP